MKEFRQVDAYGKQWEKVKPVNLGICESGRKFLNLSLALLYETFRKGRDKETSCYNKAEHGLHPLPIVVESLHFLAIHNGGMPMESSVISLIPKNLED